MELHCHLQGKTHWLLVLLVTYSCRDMKTPTEVREKVLLGFTVRPQLGVFQEQEKVSMLNGLALAVFLHSKQRLTTGKRWQMQDRLDSDFSPLIKAIFFSNFGE